MAVERRVTVGWGDLRAIVLECTTPGCGARLTLPPEAAKDAERIDDRCPAGHWWTEPAHRTAAAAAALRELRSALQDRPKFRVLLQFDAEEPSR